MDYKKLILFDIDGTLIRHVGESDFASRVQYAAKRAYNVQVSDFDVAHFHGSVDRDTAWSILSPSGMTYDAFVDKFDDFSKAMYEYLISKAKNKTLYQEIDDAGKLAKLLKKKTDIALGLLTGNVEKIAYWKLSHAGLKDIFSWGVFGDTANDRIELAKTVSHEAFVNFKQLFRPGEIYILGDTIYDVRCAKSIGARSIAVTTGHHGTREELVAERPDLVVDSLMDEKVIHMLF
ncbi:HAD hydrolase-like protein [Candidatus Gottesmanbacteria bacterium]|nr:HAD hydrolase-like protein [Candidatus Gottesmanbacteria bacterium]